MAKRCERDVRAHALIALLVVVALHHLPWAVSPLWFVGGMFIAIRRVPGRWLLVGGLLIAISTSWAIKRHTARVWPQARDGRVQKISGRVAGLPKTLSRRTRFVLDTPAGRRLRLSWYNDAPPLAPGDRVTGRAKLHTPHGSANPGGFDYEAWLWRKRIDATGYLKSSKRHAEHGSWSIDRVRFLLWQRLDTVLAGAPMRGVIEALAMGVRRNISDQQWRTLRRAGISHVVAISGLHIGLIAGWLFFCIRWLALRQPGRLPAEPLAAGAAFVGACAYATLAGWSLPTERAVIMVGVALAGLVFARDVQRSRLLAIAAIAVLVIQPSVVIGPGFWLSFGAVAWILYLLRPSQHSKWHRAAFVQLGLVLGLMPATLWFFGQASLIAPLVNAVVIPLAAVLVPAVLVSCVLVWTWPSAGAVVMHGLALVLGYGWIGLDWVAQLPIASTHLQITRAGTLVLAIAGLVWLWAPRGWPARWLGIVLLVPALVGWRATGFDLERGAYELTVLDVGQGSANVVRTRHHTLVFDAGPAFGQTFDAGRMIVVPYVRWLGLNRIDTLVVSHSDLDHAGGADAIVSSLTVDTRRGSGSDRPCRAGQHWQWDGVVFRFVYPTSREARRAANDNARSCVLAVRGAGGTTLLTGDIETPAEAKLLRRRADLSADVLVVAHHGSDTSTSRPFVRRIRPRLALISSGWHNRWHFPAVAVVDRLRRAGARVVNTARSGAIRVRVGETIELSRWRRARQRFWQRPIIDR